MNALTRRGFCGVAAAAFAAGCASVGMGKRRKLSLNPATIREFALPLKEQVRLAMEAGYDGMEPWLKDVHAAKAAGELADIRKMADDAGFRFINGIAFGKWAHPDVAVRKAGMEETARDMAALAELGCPCIAASMFGLHKPGSPRVTRDEVAERYAAVLDLGRKHGIRPLLEYWGHSIQLFRPEHAIAVVRATGRTDVGILPDVYHTYRGGGAFETFRRFDPAWVPVLHVNDYPATPPRAQLTDADRIWPGDGIAPWKEIFAALDGIGASSWLSLELFNKSYQQGTPAETLATGLAKMRAL